MISAKCKRKGNYSDWPQKNAKNSKKKREAMYQL